MKFHSLSTTGSHQLQRCADSLPSKLTPTTASPIGDSAITSADLSTDNPTDQSDWDPPSSMPAHRLSSPATSLLNSARHYSSALISQLTSSLLPWITAQRRVTRVTVSRLTQYDDPAIITNPLQAQLWMVNLKAVKRYILFLQAKFGAHHYYVNVSFASPHTSQQLNFEHRNQNASTDVLAFPQLPTHPDALFQPATASQLAQRHFHHGNHLGDIVICLAKVVEYALDGRHNHQLSAPTHSSTSPRSPRSPRSPKLPKSPKSPTARIEHNMLTTLTHGYLHLLGYDHHQTAHYHHMNSTQQECINLWHQQQRSSCIHPMSKKSSHSNS